MADPAAEQTQQLRSQAELIHAETQSLTDLPKTVTVESFRKIRLIGKGDVGRVYLVQLVGTSHYFAMKILIKQQMINRNKIKRVSTERDILLTTKHPFIVHLFWSFSTPTCFYFIMNYCAGGDFYNTLRNATGKCLPEETVKFYLAEVLLALEYLHLNGIIYRDLKPENILFHESGHIMLSDFDLSKTQPNPPSSTSIRQAIVAVKGKLKTEPDYVTNSFVGTEEYLAPEVITGYGHSGSVDWWTFGILMYEMLFGKTPFLSRTRDRTFSLILDGEVQFPKNHRYPVSSSAKDLIKRLLVNDPNKRLGAKKGALEIKAHKFFKTVKFQLIRNLQPPIVPRLNGPEDTSMFKEIPDDNEVALLEQQARELEAQAAQQAAQGVTRLSGGAGAFGASQLMGVRPGLGQPAQPQQAGATASTAPTASAQPAAPPAETSTQGSGQGTGQPTGNAPVQSTTQRDAVQASQEVGQVEMLGGDHTTTDGSSQPPLHVTPQTHTLSTAQAIVQQTPQQQSQATSPGNPSSLGGAQSGVQPPQQSSFQQEQQGTLPSSSSQSPSQPSIQTVQPSIQPQQSSSVSSQTTPFTSQPQSPLQLSPQPSHASLSSQQPQLIPTRVIQEIQLAQVPRQLSPSSSLQHAGPSQQPLLSPTITSPTLQQPRNKTSPPFPAQNPPSPQLHAPPPQKQVDPTPPMTAAMLAAQKDALAARPHPLPAPQQQQPEPHPARPGAQGAGPGAPGNIK